MRHILMSIQKIQIIGLVGIEFWRRYPQNAKLETEFSGYLGQVFHCSWKNLLLGSEWEGKRRVSGDQLIFWPFNSRFDHSTCVLTVQLAFWPLNVLGMRISVWTSALWQFNLCFDNFGSHFKILAQVSPIWLTFYRFSSRFTISACVSPFQLPFYHFSLHFTLLTRGSPF